jgi:hypothetical protein
MTKLKNEKLKPGFYRSTSKIWFNLLVTPDQIIVLDDDGLPRKISSNIVLPVEQNVRYYNNSLYEFTSHEE